MGGTRSGTCHPPVLKTGHNPFFFRKKTGYEGITHFFCKKTGYGWGRITRFFRQKKRAINPFLNESHVCTHYSAIKGIEIHTTPLLHLKTHATSYSLCPDGGEERDESGSGGEEEEDFETETMIAQKVHRGHTLYFVRKKGCGKEDCSWESVAHLKGCKELVDAFEASERDSSCAKRWPWAKALM